MTLFICNSDNVLVQTYVMILSSWCWMTLAVNRKSRYVASDEELLPLAYASDVDARHCAHCTSRKGHARRWRAVPDDGQWYSVRGLEPHVPVRIIAVVRLLWLLEQQVLARHLRHWSKVVACLKLRLTQNWSRCCSPCAQRWTSTWTWRGQRVLSRLMASPLGAWKSQDQGSLRVDSLRLAGRIVRVWL